MLKRTHTKRSFKSPLLPLLPPPFIITLLHPHCGPLGHLPPACLGLFTLLEREGPERGQWRLSERLSTPWLSKEVSEGASQHPFHKLHSLPPHFLPTLTCLTHSQIHTLFLCLPPTSQNVALRSAQCRPVGIIRTHANRFPVKSCCLGDVSSIQDPHPGFVYGGF